MWKRSQAAGGGGGDVIVFNEFDKAAGNYTIDIPISGTLNLMTNNYYSFGNLKVNGTTITRTKQVQTSYSNCRYWETPVQVGDTVVFECTYPLTCGMGYITNS